MYWIGEPLNGEWQPSWLSPLWTEPSHSRDWSWLVRGSDRCSGVMTASVVFLGARALTLGLVSTTSSRLMMPGS